jgi:hypothetical protein
VLDLLLHFLDRAREFERLCGRLPQHMEREPLGAAAADARHARKGVDQATHRLWIGCVRHDSLRPVR